MYKNITATNIKSKLIKELLLIILIFQMMLPMSSFAENSSSDNLPTDSLLSNRTHQDYDNDGISDYLEMNGYMINNDNYIIEWDGNENSNYHKSDPNSASTTGDPYDDRSKLAGSSLHSGIDPVARNNPEVAATPNLQVELLGIGLAPKITTTSEESGGLSSGNSHSQGGSSSDSHTFTTGVSIGFEHTFKVTEGPSTKMSVETSFEHSYAMEKTSTWNIEESTSNFKNWLKSKQLDESDAAALSLDLKYTNTGLTPLSNVRPRFTIIAGDENVLTYTPYGDQQAIDYLAPGESKYITVDRISKSDTLSLSSSQLDKVLDNRKLRIKMIEVLADIPGETIEKSNIFSYYQDDIKGRTADIEIRRTNSNGDTYTSKTYQVVAEHSSYDPHMTLKRALQLTMKAEVGADDNLYLENKSINDWNISYNDDLKKRISSLDYNEKKYYDVELKHTDHIIIYEPLEREIPEIKWFAYSNDYRNIGVNIARGNDGITSVTATVKINNKEQTLTLDYNPNINLYVNKTDFLYPADASFRSRINVTTKSGREIEKTITPEKEGFGYVPLSDPELLMGQRETKNLLSGSNDIDISRFPNARALAIQVTSHRWSAPKTSVTLGNVTAELGTGDLHLPRWKLKITDTTGKIHILEGTGELYELSDVSKKGIPNDGITKVELTGDKGFAVQLYKHGDFNYSYEDYGEYTAWTFYNIDDTSKEVDLKNYNAQDLISSLRVAYVGTNEQNAFYHLWLRDRSNGKVTYTRDNKNLTEDISQLGVHNDCLGDYSFIAYPTLKLTAYVHGSQSGEWYIPRSSSGTYEFLPFIGISSVSVKGFEYNQIEPTYLKGAKNSPVISKTIVVPVMGANLKTSWDIQSAVKNLDYEDTDAWIDVELLGYFTDKPNEGYKYKPVNMDYDDDTRTNTSINGSSNTYKKFFTGIDNAKGYIINVMNDKISSDKVSITINGVTTNLGASDPRLTEADWWTTKKDSDWSASDNLADEYKIGHTNSLRKSNIIFVPANSYSPDFLDISSDISDYRTSSTSPKVIISVLGYFSEDAELVFVPDHKVEDHVGNSHKVNVNDEHFPKVFIGNLSIPYDDVLQSSPLQNGMYVRLNTSSTNFLAFADHYIGDKPINGLYYSNNRPLRDYDIHSSWNDTSLVYTVNKSNYLTDTISVGHRTSRFDLLGYFH